MRHGIEVSSKLWRDLGRVQIHASENRGGADVVDNRREPMTTRRNLLFAGAALAANPVFGATAADWNSATPESQDFDPRAVADTLQAGESLPGLCALLVARRGVLVGERYYGGATADSVLPINSATKSVCSMLVGLALRDGRLKSLDETVAQLLPEAVAELPESPAASVTLRPILSGRTGLAFDLMRFREVGRAPSLAATCGASGSPSLAPGT